jgi:hypothetical protein
LNFHAFSMARFRRKVKALHGAVYRTSPFAILSSLNRPLER